MECPFKNRVENGGRLIAKANFTPKAKNFMKRVPQKALIANEQEYISGGEESDEDSEQVGMAAKLASYPHHWVLTSPLPTTRKAPPTTSVLWPRVYPQRWLFHSNLQSPLLHLY